MKPLRKLSTKEIKKMEKVGTNYNSSKAYFYLKKFKLLYLTLQKLISREEQFKMPWYNSKRNNQKR